MNAAMALPPIRVFRVGGGRPSLVLEEGGRLYDLSAHLGRSGQPTDLCELVRDGWFDGDTLGGRLPSATDGEGWEGLELEWDGNAPGNVLTPLAPSQVGKILAMGKNYRAHAAEFGEEVPAEPLFFNKLPETLLPHRGEVRVPAWFDGRFDHEAEIAVVIGLDGRDLGEEEAMEYVAGYSVANDLTARSLQGADRKLGHPWFRSKNLDGDCSLGPAFVPRDFLDVSDLPITCRVNGELRQEASTKDWVVGIPAAIAHLSKHLTLHTGDLILMGTPEGVGPLEEGDEVVCEAKGIGALSTIVRRGS